MITDSGGLQENHYLGIPAPPAQNTERPITVDEGTNRLATPESLPGLVEAALSLGAGRPRRPELWDGRTAGRCVADLRKRDGGG